MVENVVRILNVDIHSITQQELLQNLKKGIVITPNVDHLVKLQKDAGFYAVYQKADWVICDSKVLYLMSKLLRKKLPEAIPGSSFFTAFYQYHKDDKNCKIFLLGAAEGVAVKAMEEINLKVGWEIVVGAFSPSYGFEKDVDECNMILELYVARGLIFFWSELGLLNKRNGLLNTVSSFPRLIYLWGWELRLILKQRY